MRLSLESYRSMREAMSCRTNRFLSLGVDLAGRPCLVVGAGRIGTRKALTLAEAGAEVVVVSPEASLDLDGPVRRGQVVWRRRKFDPGDLEHVFLVVAATPDSCLNAEIGREAAGRGILCCVSSSVAASSVIFPAVHTTDLVTVAVHTDGRDCRRAKRVRDAIGRWLLRANRKAAQGRFESDPARSLPSVNVANIPVSEDSDSLS